MTHRRALGARLRTAKVCVKTNRWVWRVRSARCEDERLATQANRVDDRGWGTSRYDQNATLSNLITDGAVPAYEATILDATSG
jgi:hypothetical protein